MLVFDSYTRHGNITTYQTLAGVSTIAKCWTKSLVFTYEGNGIYYVDTKNKAENRSALPLFEEWVGTNYPKEII
jgi:hypothetical protein